MDHNNKNLIYKKSQGLSLLEILTSLLIIGVITSVTIPTISKRTGFIGANDLPIIKSPWAYTDNHATSIHFTDTLYDGKVGIGTNTPDYRLKITESASSTDSSIVAYGQGGTKPTGAGTRFMWLPNGAILRGGRATNTQWDVNGSYGSGFGVNNTIQGTFTNIAGGSTGLTRYNTHASIGGGYANTSAGITSHVTGGNTNYAESHYTTMIGGQSNSGRGVVVGGQNNDANYYLGPAIIGGYSNTTNNNYSVVIGGESNTAHVNYSTVSGGSNNLNQGSCSWVGGHNMRINSAANFSFVWGNLAAQNDPAVAPFNNPNQFLIWGDGNASGDRLHVQGNTEITGTFSIGDPAGTNYTLDPVTGLWTSSDLRLKNIVGSYDSGLDEILRLKTYNYTYKKDKKKQVVTGVIAQDLQEVLPQAVMQGKKHLIINKDPIFYALLNSIKELRARNNNLKAKIKTFEQRLEQLEKNKV